MIKFTKRSAAYDAGWSAERFFDATWARGRDTDLAAAKFLVWHLTFFSEFRPTINFPSKKPPQATCRIAAKFDPKFEYTELFRIKKDNSGEFHLQINVHYSHTAGLFDGFVKDLADGLKDAGLKLRSNRTPRVKLTDLFESPDTPELKAWTNFRRTYERLKPKIKMRIDETSSMVAP